MTGTTIFDDTSDPQNDGSLLIAPYPGDGVLAEQVTNGTAALELSTLSLILADPNTDSGTITASLYSDSAGAPGTLFATLGTIDESSLTTSPTDYTISMPAGVTLSATTSYWVELSTSNTASGADWYLTNTPSGTGVTGQSAFYDGANGGTGNSFLMALTGEAPPLASQPVFDDSSNSTDSAYVVKHPILESISNGANAAVLTQVDLNLVDASGTDAGTITVNLYADAGGAPGGLVASLGTIDETSLSATATFTTLSVSGGPTLSANTTYWVGLTNSDGTSTALWNVTDNPSGTGVSGESLDAHGTNQGTASAFLMTVDADLPAEILFDDTGNTQNGDHSIAQGPQNGDGPLAESFNSGTSASTLTAVNLVLFDPVAGQIDNGIVNVSLYSDSAGAPGTQLALLGSIDESSLPNGPTIVTLAVSSGVSLSANTTYWIELTTTDSTSSAYWMTTANPAGIGLTGQSYSLNGTNSGTSNAFLMSVDGVSTCFAAGTRILTARGEIQVEALRPGDLVLALRTGRLAPVRWIGHRRVDLAAHPKPDAINPIRIRANAFAPGQPTRDLVVSPDHAIFADGGLIAARYLLNGATVVQEAPPSVTYYHVELDAHDVLLVEGLPAESYLDVGNRNNFANGGGITTLHPAFGTATSEAIWTAQACAPPLDKGEALTALRRRLLDRAAELGHQRTSDPDLAVIARGRTIRPTRDGRDLRFDLPSSTGTISLVSRSASPKHMRAEDADGRSLGIGVRAIALDDAPLAFDDPRLLSGWHAPERVLRWTDGDARLDADSARTLTLRLHPDMTYWKGPASERPARAQA